MTGFERWLFVAILLIAGAPAAQAELIPWTYTAQAQPHAPFRTLTAELIQTEGSHATQPGDLTSVSLIRYWFGGYSPSLPTDPSSVTDTFVAGVAITDTASGQTGFTTIAVSAFEEWEYMVFEGVWEPLFMGDLSGPTAPDVLLLGGNQYLVSTESGSLIVGVEPLPGVPEPGSILLAGAGLLVAGFMSMRRRLTNARIASTC